MNRNVVLCLLLVIVALSSIASYFFTQKQTIKSAEFMVIQINKTLLRVELAKSPDEITKGLSDRESIGSDGMLFVLPARTIPKFWMYHMRFALDFVWIDGSRIVDITKNVSAPNPAAPTGALETYAPKTAVTHVLELPAGSVEKYGFVIGDTVTIRPLSIR
jgi:uncharacterized membrane protein (UPF0127 family)